MDVNKTKVIKDSRLGNGLAAALDINAGQVIISISEPFLIVVEKDVLSRICSYCFAPSETTNLKRCAGCKITQYCSATCQKSDWGSIHSKECSALKRMPGVPPTAVRGMIQILLRHTCGKHLDPKWAGLESHINELGKSKRWEEIMLQARAAVEYSKGGPALVEMALNLLCRMSTNAFRATLFDDTPVGLCFCPTLALANHSCSPNASVIFDGRHASLRSLNQIKDGEQIFISYIDPAQNVERRRAELQERYFFKCQCVTCKGNVHPYALFLDNPPLLYPAGGKLDLWWEMERLTREAEARIKEANAAYLEQNKPLLALKIPSALEQCGPHLPLPQRLVIHHQVLSDLSTLTQRKLYAIPPYPSFLNELYLYHLDTESYIQALIIMLFISHHCDPFNYPQHHHPIRVTRLFTITTLLKHIASLDTAILLPLDTPFNEDQRHLIRNIDYVSAIQALLVLLLELVGKSHGKESRFMKEVEERLREVEDVQKERGNAGLEIRRWGMQGSVAVEGKLMVETLFDGLKDLSKLIGVVVEGIEIEDEE